MLSCMLFRDEYYLVLNTFLSLNFQSILEFVNFKILDQFSHLSFEIREFSHFNHILLYLFDVLYVSDYCI